MVVATNVRVLARPVDTKARDAGAIVAEVADTVASAILATGDISYSEQAIDQDTMRLRMLM